MALLLDTCAAIWLFEGQPISARAADELNLAMATSLPVYVSPVTAWEIGLLVSLGRINLPADPQRWFDHILKAPGVRLTKISPPILIASSFLPGKPPKDPADRIFAATVRANGWRLVTRDRMLLDYARAGHIQALAC
jgi:PIN domain nuclease of toxin-antitoxin system